MELHCVNLKRKKGLGGKGKLTDAMIDRLQNYYGITIRSNVGDLAQMKKKQYMLVYFIVLHLSKEISTFIALKDPIAGVGLIRIVQTKQISTNLVQACP